MAKHRRPPEDSDDLTDILAVEVPIEAAKPETPKPKPRPGVRPPPRRPPPDRSWAATTRKAANDAKPAEFTPMFKGFDRTAPQPKVAQPKAAKATKARATDPLVAERDPQPEASPVIRRRITIMALAVGLALISFVLMVWTLMSQPTGCSKPPPMRAPFTVTVTPSTIPQRR